MSFSSDFRFGLSRADIDDVQVKRWGDAVQSSIGTSKFLLVEAVPNEWAPTWPEEDRPVNMIYAPHWSARPCRVLFDKRPTLIDLKLLRYDLKSLFNKTFGFMSVNVQGLARVRPIS